VIFCENETTLNRLCTRFTNPSPYSRMAFGMVNRLRTPMQYNPAQTGTKSGRSLAGVVVPPCQQIVRLRISGSVASDFRTLIKS